MVLQKGNKFGNIFVHFPEEDIMTLVVMIIGPPGTPYENGFFHFFFRYLSYFG